MSKIKKQLKQRLQKLKTRQAKKNGTSRIVCIGKQKGYKFIIRWLEEMEQTEVIDRIKEHIGLMEKLESNCYYLKDWAAGKRAAYEEAKKLLEGLTTKTA